MKWGKPCPRCLPLAKRGTIRMTMLRPLPDGALAPLAIDGSGPCCDDCGAADAIVKAGLLPNDAVGFASARVAVGNEREESLRLVNVPRGPRPYARESKPGDLDRIYDWLDENNWFGGARP